jgi:hypothetical protein
MKYLELEEIIIDLRDYMDFDVIRNIVISDHVLMFALEKIKHDKLPCRFYIWSINDSNRIDKGLSTKYCVNFLFLDDGSYKFIKSLL